MAIEPGAMEQNAAHSPVRTAADADPGLGGVVPFRFACHRCGHCCSAGSGYVWLAETEIERIAAALGASAESFTRRFVRSVRDPESGVERLSLREDDRGRCALLVGTNTCSVYDARPDHCRAFPYWPSVLADRTAFESARSTCPGIAVEVEPATRARAFAALEAFYAALPVADEPRTCCLNSESEERTFASALEADYALAGRPDVADVAGACRLGERRPLACRVHREAGAEDVEEHLSELRSLERGSGYPRAYGELSALLRARTRTSGLEEAGS